MSPSNSSSRSNAPGPTAIHFPKIVLDFYRDPILLFDRLHKQFGDIVRLEGAGYCAHLLTQPEHIKHVLQDNARNYHIGAIFDETTRVVGRGLTTNSGQTWLKQRRMVQSAFQHQYIDKYGNVIISIADRILSRWQEYLQQGHEIEIVAETQVINLQILGGLLFSVDFKIDDPFLEALAIVRKVSIDRVRSIIKSPFQPHFEQAAQTLDKFTYEQIEQRRNGNVPMDILSLLMGAQYGKVGIGMTDTELHDEIMTLFFAAYEDVANALAWTWYLLTQNPDSESKLRAEVHNTIGERLPTASDLRNLPYLSMLVDEVLRLYPTTWSLLRDVVSDDEIGGFHIPAKSMIFLDLHLTHRLPKYWDNPKRFDPERFSPERSEGRPRFAYFPFGGGPRQCIGNELALMEIRLILIRMIQLYRFELVSKHPIQINALSSLQPRNGVWVKAKAGR
jgi:cytochrome P450